MTSAIRKARDAWEKEDSERSIKRHDKQTIQRISHLAIENLLEKYFYQENTTAVHTELTTLLPELSNASNCTLCVLDHRYCYQPAGTLAPNYVAIESSLRDILQRTGSGYLIHYSAKPSQSILFIYRQHDSILRALEKVIMEVNLHTQLSLHLGVCGPLPFPLCFRKAYDQAEAAFFYVLAAARRRFLFHGRKRCRSPLLRLRLTWLPFSPACLVGVSRVFVPQSVNSAQRTYDFVF